MSRRGLLREAVSHPLDPAAAVAAGFILSAEHRVAGRPVYATTAWAEEIDDAGESDWAGAATLLAAGTMRRHQGAGRVRIAWRVGDRPVPTLAVIQPSAAGGMILLQLDGE